MTLLAGVSILQAETRKLEVVPSSEVKWEKLNPARGDKSPQAGTLWGDRKGAVPTGFLAKFVDGFSSPPHIHNVSYRAVVLDGLIHNDDPNATHMWMPSGSFWTQPAGELHITAAKGNNSIALVEIDKSPYLVLPKEKAHDNGERPINIDVTNLMWTKHSDISTAKDVKVAFLSGNVEENKGRSMFLKLPKAFSGTLESYGKTFRAVVIKGELEYKMPKNNEMKTLDLGSYFGSEGNTTHSLLVSQQGESILYLRTNASVKVIAK